MNRLKTKREVISINDKLKEVMALKDSEGNILQKIASPLIIEFHPKDLLQVIVGASILAIPVGFTEETWKLGEQLPWLNVSLLLGLSLLFVSLFIYYNYYRNHLNTHSMEFFKRVFATYTFSFLVVATLLSIINVAPWTADFMLALKRAIIVTFPASMSAAVADTIK